MRPERFPISSALLPSLCLSALLLVLHAPGAGAQAVDTTLLGDVEARGIGPAGMSGRVAAIEGVPGDPTVLYVGAATGGVWKSEDAGTTWTSIFDDQPVASIGDIEVHPRNPDLVWVGTGEGNLRNSMGVGRGIFRSRDGGESWEWMGLRESEHIHRIELHPFDPRIVYVAATGPAWSDGGQRGVYRTTDGGETWTRVLAGPNERTGASDVVMDPSNPDKLFASLWEFRRWPHFFESGGPGSGLYVTHDGGESWTRIGADEGYAPEDRELGRIGVAIAPSDPDVVYALTEAERSVLYRSDDGGESWSEVNRERGIAPRPFYYGTILVDPAEPDRIYNIGGDLTVSTDGGRSFRGAATWGDGVHVDHHALWIHPDDPQLVVDGNDGGVYISRDRADTWRFVENLPLSQFYEIDLDMDVPYNVYGGLQDNGSWRGPNEVWASGGVRNYHWTEIGFGDGFGALDDPDEPRYGFSMSQRGFLNRWDLVTGNRRNIRPAPPSEDVELRFNWNAPIALDPFEPNTVYFGSQFVHRSTDDGLSWEVISPDLTTDSAAWQRQEESGGLTYDVTGAENYTTLFALAPSPVERGVLWAGSDDGRLHVTRDGGDSWTEVTDELPDAPDHPYVSHIEASKFEAGAAFVVLHDYRRGDWGTYVYRTDDFGGSWDRIAGEDVDGFARTLEQDPVRPGLLYLGTEFGLRVSPDGGESWMRWTRGVPPAPVHALAVHPRDHDLVVATHGRGVFVLDDVRFLRELSEDPSRLESRLHLFEPPSAIRHEVASPKVYRFGASTQFEGENPPYGALLTFATTLPEPDSTERVELQVLRADSVIRREEVEAERGLNRIAWDLRREGFRRLKSEEEREEERREVAREIERRAAEVRARQEQAETEDPAEAEEPGDPEEAEPGAGEEPGEEVPGEAPEAEEEEEAEDEEPPRRPGPEVLPGEYTIRMIAGGDTAVAPVEVRADPRTEIEPAARRAKYEALVRTGRAGERATLAVERIRDTKESVTTVLTVLERRPGAAPAGVREELREAGTSLLARLTTLEVRLSGPVEEVQGIRRSNEDVLSRLGFAYGSLSSSPHAPTETQRTLVRRAEGELETAMESLERLYDAEVADFRQRVDAAGLELVPGAEASP